ncbi:MAG TPA: DUF4012 domain-containing protein [Candidatus Woesebacteria bacterium]|nr:DUF4012 domain-containing protein [Candidatus Woesebacteria bacterium]
MEALISAAIIFGIDNFVAVKLVSKLREQGIKIIDGETEEIPKNAAYIFDFEGREREWEKLEKNQKLVLVSNNQKQAEEWKNKLDGSFLNWRIVFGENVYGEGMSEEGFLGQAFLTAARNKNLILPSLDQVYRVLAVEDFVEAILRACFFSGTSGKFFCIGGCETNSKIVAEVLLDEAKMTRTKVIQDQVIMSTEVDTNLVEESEKLLRWQPKITFKQGAKEAVQYFVAKVDADNRKKAAIKSNDFKPKIEEEKRERRFEVEIEEETRDEKLEIRNEKMEEMEIEIEEEKIETRNKILDSREEEKEIVFEKFVKSPIPERVINEREENKESLKSKKEEKREENLPPEADQPLAEKPKEKEKKKNNKWWRWGLGAVLLIFLVVLIINIIKVVSIPKNILRISSLIEENNYVEAEKKIKILASNNEKNLAVFETGKVGSLLRIESEVIELLKLNLELVKSGEKISQGLFGETEVEMEKELSEVAKKTEMVISKMGILQGRLSGQWGWLPSRFRSDLNKIKVKLESQRKTAEKMNEILRILPEMIGLDGKRREYLVLLQNENEIRPSGGFIGSFAILAFEGGRFLNFQVNDIYEADGQLRGHVEPPEEIKKYLGEAGWYMRDANWQASFPLVSRDVQWFLDKETGRKVDGVIGLNLASVKAVLGVMGEIFVPDFKEKVNENNLYEQAEFYSDNKFFAGSGQKASFLGGVSKQLMEEIKMAKGNVGQKLLTTIVDLLDRNEIQISFNNSEAAKVIAEAGWDGSIYEGKCPSTSSGQVGCFADYLYLVEANMGVNKANYFLYRNIEREVEIGEKIIKNKLKIIYENTSKSTNWPAGDYKNYLRVYIPAESRVEEVNWSESGSGEKNIVSGENLKINLNGSKREVGFLVTVPISKKIEVEVKYSAEIDLSKVTTFSYLNYVQKQSGYGETNIVSLISVPTNWQINAVEPVASVVGGKLLFNQKLEKDIKMGVEIER